MQENVGYGRVFLIAGQGVQSLVPHAWLQEDWENCSL